MKLKGSALIRVIDSRTLEVKEEREQGNVIFDATLLSILSWEPGNIFGRFNSRISISTQTSTPSVGNPTLTQITGTGDVPSGATSPQFYPTASPVFGEIRNIINAVGVPRTFYTVGLTNLSAGDVQGNLTTTARCYLLLDLPCTQGQFDFLDIYYRIEFLQGGQRISPEGVIDFGRATFGLGRFKISHLAASWAKKPVAVYKNLVASNQPSLASFEFGSPDQWTAGIRVDSHFKWKQALSQGENWQVGTILSLFLAGNSNDRNNAYRWEQYPGKTNRIQNGFFQKSGSNKPFFDPTNFGSSTGKIILSEQSANSWGDKFPEIYRFNVVAGGAAGVATYKFSVRKFLGFNGNTYQDQSVPCPFRNTAQPAADGFHGWRTENNDTLRYSSTKVVQYDLTGVTLLDLVTGDYQNWDSTTTPALLCSQIRQCATDGEKIWVGDRTAGLYEIDPTANTITQRIGAGCYGVDVGRAGKVWALVEGGLRNSDAWLTNLTFSYTGISDSNWNKAMFLKVDPENVSDRIALMVDVGSSQYRVVWWDAASTTAITGYQSSGLKPWPSSFDVSDIGGFWASDGIRHSYGSNSIAGIFGSPKLFISHSVWGSDYYYKISFYNQYLICSDRLVDSNNTTINTYNGLPDSTTLLHIDGGITLLSSTMRQLFSDNTYCWQNYGWNGANWELNNNNPKTTHVTDDALINGLQVKFQNGANPPHFFATDFFVVPVCNGLVKDSASTFYWQSAWYTKPVNFDIPVPGGVTVPGGLVYTFPAASDPAFLFMETDSIKLYNLALNGVPCPTVYLDGTTNPAPGEVTIDGAGFAKFNATDVGKTLTGTYCWVGFS